VQQAATRAKKRLSAPTAACCLLGLLGLLGLLPAACAACCCLLPAGGLLAAGAPRVPSSQRVISESRLLVGSQQAPFHIPCNMYNE
jgi:hypothetical protein